MEVVVDDIVIVGAGIAGLATSVGLHRLGIRSLVLESSEGLRATGFALTTWNNAWRALDALGIGDSLRKQHLRLFGIVVTSTISGQPSSEKSLKTKGKHGENEVRCVKRKLLLEALESELPRGTIRYSSKVVSLEESGCFKLVHLADGTLLKTKVLIGCDGVNSVVAKWLGFKKPAFAGRSDIRGYADYVGSHGLEPKFLQFNGKGFRFGFFPCDDQTVYWFFNWSPSKQGLDKELEDNSANMKQYVLSKSHGLPDQVKNIIENTPLDRIMLSPLRYRYPWEVLWGDISKGNVCVAGDALHPMTPDTGQGGCAALEDSIVLARCIAEALTKKPTRETKDREDENVEGFKRIEMGLKMFANERRWRSFDLISTAYVVGFIQQMDGKLFCVWKKLELKDIMDQVENIVIVGAGIAGLTTSLGLHRLRIRSLVLESSEGLRVTGFDFTTWSNAWRALDALGIGDSLRQQHLLLESFAVILFVEESIKN